jgi:hypothetical protein
MNNHTGELTVTEGTDSIVKLHQLHELVNVAGDDARIEPIDAALWIRGHWIEILIRDEPFELLSQSATAFAEHGTRVGRGLLVPDRVSKHLRLDTGDGVDSE